MGKMGLKCLMLAIGTLLASQAAAQSKPAALKLCHEDQESFPYIIKDKPGTIERMMKLLEKQVGVPIEVVGIPWKRCLDSLKEGTMDGAFPASFRADRLEIGAYPMTADGKPDTAKRTHTSGYSLYRMKGSNVEWDGSKIVNNKQAIGAQAGFSVVETLKKAGVNVDEGTKSADDALKKLVAGRVDGVALQPTNGDNLLEKNPEYKQKVEKAPKPIEEKPYYLMLSHKLVKQHPEFAKQMWDKIGQIRESAEFKKIEAEYLK